MVFETLGMFEKLRIDCFAPLFKRPSIVYNPLMQREDERTAGDIPEAPLNAQEEWSEFLRTVGVAMLLALTVRMFWLEPFNIPSSSMKPTLEIGDYLFVSKTSYGYGQYSFSLPFGFFIPAPFEGRVMMEEDELPQRGDVIVFWLPDKRQNYIKRIVGMPGETVQVLNGRLYINQELVPRTLVGQKEVTEDFGQTTPMMEYKETLPGGIVHSIYEESDGDVLDNTPEYVVPEGHYFAMGDNRDNSQDSRVTNEVGAIPLENIVGRAARIFFSIDGLKIRFSRFLKDIQPEREG